MQQSRYHEYRTFLYQNHLRNANQIGGFNPSLLLRLAQGQTEFQTKLIDIHERAHAMLCCSVYGRMLFFLKFIALDGVGFWSFEETEGAFPLYWNLFNKSHEVISVMINYWVITHEGLATFGDVEYLKSSHHPEAEELRQILVEVINDGNNPYQQGYTKVRSLADLVHDDYRNAYISGIIHELANIDFTYLVESPSVLRLQQEFKTFSPDHMLDEISIKLRTPKGQRFLQGLRKLDYINLTRQYLADQGYRQFEGITSKPLLERLLMILLKDWELPLKYQVRVGELLSKLDTIYTSLALTPHQSTIFFLSAHRKQQGQLIKTIIEHDYTANMRPDSIKARSALIREAQALCDLDHVVNLYLPHDPLAFRTEVRKTAVWFGQEHDYLLLFNAFQ